MDGRRNDPSENDMRWARYKYQDTVSYGIVTDGVVEPVSGTPWGEFVRSGKSFRLEAVELLPPVIPGTFYAVGFNYLGHTAEAGEFLKKPQKIPSKPDVGYRSASALIGAGAPVRVPAESAGFIQFEGELVAVIGKTAKHVPQERALDYVLGFTIGNDISERAWQAADRTVWRSKNTDTFKPMGPWIETEVSLPELLTRVRLNGQVVSEFKTNDMLFGVERYIAEITKFVTLHPGDVLWMGTEAPTLDMRAGDVVEVEINQIGVLRNPIAAAAAGG
jgi:2-keto-4-pentenoate hydratase/2-oxohepta-3-ene-1,7-dioic acid hydratase in catechol pathway